MDKDVRALWKTRPWIGMGVALLMLYLIIRSLLNGQVKFENRKYGDPQYIRWEDEPVHFVIVLSILALLLLGALAFCVFRFRRRSKFMREDAERQ